MSVQSEGKKVTRIRPHGPGEHDEEEASVDEHGVGGSDDDGVFVNMSEVLIDEELFDLEVDNGVVHVIDAVLLPE